MSGVQINRKLAYTVEEAGDLVSLSRAQVYRLIDLGELKTVKIGKCRRITFEQLESFLMSYELRDGFVRNNKL